jgi:hypothetical protein
MILVFFHPHRWFYLSATNPRPCIVYCIVPKDRCCCVIWEKACDWSSPRGKVHRSREELQIDPSKHPQWKLQAGVWPRWSHPSWTHWWSTPQSLGAGRMWDMWPSLMKLHSMQLFQAPRQLHTNVTSTSLEHHRTFSSKLTTFDFVTHTKLFIRCSCNPCGDSRIKKPAGCEEIKWGAISVLK